MTASTPSPELSIGQLSASELGRRLADGLRLRIGPFNVAIQSDEPTLATQVGACYPDYRIIDEQAFAHAGVRVARQRLRYQPWRREGVVWLDDGAMFSDFEPGQGLPYLEWAINWCIATRCHFYLMLHAAVVEKRGLAVILPGLPGAGKSTLSAFLAHHGWRLLSDEFCIMRPGNLQVVPFPRLIPLKNESIGVMADAAPTARIGPRFIGTRKGDVAHVTPPGDHAVNQQTATPALMIKPRYEKDSPTRSAPLAQAQCFVELSNNAFNYQILGRDGFDAVAELTDTVPAYELVYSDLVDAQKRIEQLLDETYPLN